jgi:hypothetical protein
VRPCLAARRCVTRRFVAQPHRSFAASKTSSESSEEEESEKRPRCVPAEGALSPIGTHNLWLAFVLRRSYHMVLRGLILATDFRLVYPHGQRNNVNNSPKPETSGSRSRSLSVYSRTHVSLSTFALVPEATKRAHAVSRYSVSFQRFTLMHALTPFSAVKNARHVRA